jgi:pimeloyl-ACP methyl ester carboxylesterase
MIELSSRRERLTTPVLALGGEKSYGAGMAIELEFVATDVCGVIPNSGHWIMEENRAATTKTIVDFLAK